MSRSLARAFSVFYFSRFCSPSFPRSLATFSPSYYISHLIMIHTWPFVFTRLLVKMNRARARARDKGASKRANGQFFFLLFLPIVYVCAHTHCLFFPLRRPIHKGYSISSLQSLSSSVYFYLLFTYERERRKKENVKQAIGRAREYESG